MSRHHASIPGVQRTELPAILIGNKSPSDRDSTYSNEAYHALEPSTKRSASLSISSSNVNSVSRNVKGYDHNESALQGQKKALIDPSKSKPAQPPVKWGKHPSSVVRAFNGVDYFFGNIFPPCILVYVLFLAVAASAAQKGYTLGGLGVDEWFGLTLAAQIMSVIACGFDLGHASYLYETSADEFKTRIPLYAFELLGVMFAMFNTSNISFVFWRATSEFKHSIKGSGLQHLDNQAEGFMERQFDGFLGLVQLAPAFSFASCLCLVLIRYSEKSTRSNWESKQNNH